MLSRSIGAAQLNGNPFGVQGALSSFLSRLGWSESRFLNARCASSVVPMPVVPGVVRRRVMLIARYAGVVRNRVVLMARYAQGDRVPGVIQIDAGCAGCDRKCVWFH